MSGIVVGYGDRVVVDSNEIEKANNGGEHENLSVLRESSFVTVTNNVVHDNGNDAKGGEGIDIKQGSHDVLVEGNTVYNNTKVGIYVDAWDKPTYNILINKNKVYGTGKSGITLGSECGGPLRNVTISNNLVYNNTRHGINIGIWGDVFGQCGSPAPTPGNINSVKIVNNTIVANGQNGINYTRDIGVPIHPEFGNIYIANNLIHDNGHKTLNFKGCPISHNGNPDVVSFYTITNNLLNGTSGYPRCDWGSEMLGASSILANPLLVSATDFHLTPTSPAIDAGTANHAPNHDYDGSVRPMNGVWDVGAYEFTGQPPVLNITTTSLANGIVGTAYNAQANATGGTTPYTWALVAGSLPPGLTLGSDGKISGTPSVAGTFNFTLGVTDKNAATDTQAVSMVIAAQPTTVPPDITTTNLTGGTVGSAYNATLQVSNGTAPYSWVVSSGSLPAGLTLNSAGVISGTPTSAGAATFSVKVTDAKGATDTQALSLAIVAAPPVSGNADMALTAFKATKTSVTKGTAAEFSFTVRNNGNDTATNARFVLPLPANMAWISGGNGSECSATTTQVTCNFGNLSKGASRTRYLYLRPLVAASYTLTGTATSDKGDSNLSNNNATVTVTAQ